MFQKSVDEIGASITVDQSIIAIQAEEAAVKLKKYVKECVNTYDRWRKANLFEVSPVHSDYRSRRGPLAQRKTTLERRYGPLDNCDRFE